MTLRILLQITSIEREHDAVVTVFPSAEQRQRALLQTHDERTVGEMLFCPHTMLGASLDSVLTQGVYHFFATSLITTKRADGHSDLGDRRRCFPCLDQLECGQFARTVFARPFCDRGWKFDFNVRPISAVLNTKEAAYRTILFQSLSLFRHCDVQVLRAALSCV